MIVLHPGHMTNDKRLDLQFCVRPNMRNHNTLKRDAIIKTIAGLVGQPHRVDLKNYDLLITVEIYKVGSSLSPCKQLQAIGEECYVDVLHCNYNADY